jgi:AraC family transcriptional regulator
MPKPVAYHEWLQHGRLAPYVTARALAGDSIHMFETAQPPGDMSDPPSESLLLLTAISDGIENRSDLGGGRFEERTPVGAFFLVPPDCATEIEVRNSHTLRVFMLPAGHCQQLLDNSSDSALHFGRLHRGSFRSNLLSPLTERLWNGGARGSPVSRLFADGAITVILDELARLGKERRTEPPPAPRPDWRIRRTIAQLEERLAEDVGLADLAAEVDLKPRRYTALFRAATGLPPHAWVMKRRVECACEILVDPRRSITDIAVALGFASSQHFATVFRKHMGATPSEYRRQRML